MPNTSKMEFQRYTGGSQVFGVLWVESDWTPRETDRVSYHGAKVRLLELETDSRHGLEWLL